MESTKTNNIILDISPKKSNLGDKKRSFICDVSQINIKHEESENFEITEEDIDNEDKKKITIQCIVNKNDNYKVVKISEDTFVFKFIRNDISKIVNFENISSSSSSHRERGEIQEDKDLLEYGRNAIITIAEDCEHKSKKTQSTAKWCLNINNFIIIATVFLSFVNAALGEFSECENIPVTVIGATIGILNSIYGIMSIPSRGIKFKNMSIEFMKISRAARQSLFYMTSANDLVDFSNQLRNEADEIDLTNFKTSLNNSKDNFNKSKKDLNIEN